MTTIQAQPGVREYQLFIGGSWTPAASGETFDSLNPFTGEVWAKIPLAGAADVDRAVRAARAAFPAWKSTFGKDRARLLRRLADLIDAHVTLVTFLGGAPDEVPDRYREATPQSWLDRPVPPTLLVHGEADQIVRPNQSVRLASALRSAGQRVGLLLVPWAGHGFDAVPGGFRAGLINASVERFLASVLR